MTSSDTTKPPTFSQHGSMTVIVIGVGFLFCALEMGLGAQPGTSTEWFSSLAILALLIIGCARSKLKDHGTMFPATSLWPLLFVPAFFLGIHTLLHSWWAGGFIEIRSPVYDVMCSAMLSAPVSVLLWFAVRRLRHFRQPYRSLVTVKRASRVLVALAIVLTSLAVSRRMTHPSPDAILSTPGTPATAGLSVPRGGAWIQLDESHSVSLDRSSADGRGDSRGYVSIRNDWTGEKITVGGFLFRDFSDTQVAVIRPLKLLVVTSAGRAGTSVCRWDSDCRKLTPLTLGQHLAPPMGWIAMGLFALWFASLASRKVDPRLGKWKLAQYTVAHEIVVDGVQCSKIHEQIRVPNGVGECWVICDELPESEHPFRGTADKRVEQLALIDPALVELRYRQWALSSAVLMLLPLVIAAFARMVTG